MTVPARKNVAKSVTCARLRLGFCAICKEIRRIACPDKPEPIRILPASEVPRPQQLLTELLGFKLLLRCHAGCICRHLVKAGEGGTFLAG